MDADGTSTRVEGDVGRIEMTGLLRGYDVRQQNACGGECKCPAGGEDGVDTQKAPETCQCTPTYRDKDRFEHVVPGLYRPSDPGQCMVRRGGGRGKIARQPLRRLIERPHPINKIAAPPALLQVALDCLPPFRGPLSQDVEFQRMFVNMLHQVSREQGSGPSRGLWQLSLDVFVAVDERRGQGRRFFGVSTPSGDRRRPANRPSAQYTPGGSGGWTGIHPPSVPGGDRGASERTSAPGHRSVPAGR